MRRQLTIVGILIIALLIVDQAIKLYIKANFLPWEYHNVIGEWFKIRYTENQGMAFGTTFGSGIWHKLALSIFRFIAVIFYCLLYFQGSKEGGKNRISYSHCARFCRCNRKSNRLYAP